MTRGADYCGIAEKPCEHRYNMSGNDCVECRHMFLKAEIEDLKKQIRRK